MNWKDLVLAALLALALTAAIVKVSGAEESLQLPADAQLLQEIPLPCGGILSMYDTDKDPSNGAEYVTIAGEDGKPLAIVEYSLGLDGEFQRAVVRLPGQGDVYFMQAAALSNIYPHPCDIVQAAGVKTQGPISVPLSTVLNP